MKKSMNPNKVVLALLVLAASISANGQVILTEKTWKDLYRVLKPGETTCEQIKKIADELNCDRLVSSLKSNEFFLTLQFASGDDNLGLAKNTLATAIFKFYKPYVDGEKLGLDLTKLKPRPIEDLPGEVRYHSQCDGLEVEFSDNSPMKLISLLVLFPNDANKCNARN